MSKNSLWNEEQLERFNLELAVTSKSLSVSVLLCKNRPYLLNVTQGAMTILVVLRPYRTHNE